MGLKVISAGLQTTLQASPFSGYRHIGMPAAGAADCLSFALANRLVQKPTDQPALEITMTKACFEATTTYAIALTGAAEYLHINGSSQNLHETVIVKSGDAIEVGPARKGCRSYLAVSVPLNAQEFFGNQSTCMSAKSGGLKGRALKDGDIVECQQQGSQISSLVTPQELRPAISDKYLLRLVKGPELSALTAEGQENLFAYDWQIGQRASRMGILLEARDPLETSGISMKSSAVFPGTIQCPPGGRPFLLGADAQTTGGYPRIAQVIRADRHLIGQLRPGASIQFVRCAPDQAARLYREKCKLLHDWLGPVRLW